MVDWHMNQVSAIRRTSLEDLVPLYVPVHQVKATFCHVLLSETQCTWYFKVKSETCSIFIHNWLSVLRASPVNNNFYVQINMIDLVYSY